MAHPADHPGPFALVDDLDAPTLLPEDAHHLERVLRLRVQHQPDVDHILAVGMEELKAKLSSEQQSQLDGLHAQLQRRWRLTREYVQQAQDTKGRKE